MNLGLRLQVLDFVHKAVDEADNSTLTLRVNLGDVSLAIKVHRLVPESEVVERGGRVRSRRDAGMAVLWTLFATVQSGR